MRVLFLSRIFYPHIGGVEKHVLEISKILIKKGYKITVVTELYNRSLSSREQISGISILRIPVSKKEFSKKFVIWKWFIKNIGLIKNADIIHCHDVFFWYLPFRFLFFKKKVFTTFHGYESFPISKKAIIVRKLSEKLSHGNICIGKFIEKWYGTKADYILYGGTQVKKNKKQEARNLINKESALFIGRLDEQTGIQEYVEAVEQIRKKVPQFKFTIIGDGKFKKYIKNKNKVMGWKINPERYFTFYQFAFVSRYLSILEAMVAKRLVFALFDNPIKKDYLKMTPFSRCIIICSNKDELVKKVTYYLNHLSKERQLVNKSFQWAKNHTWERIADTYIRLWSKK